MTIPPRFLDEVRNRLTLSDVIGKRIKITRAGREFKACCPFHKEKTPSFTINDDKQFYHCFGCGAHGDVIGFAMQHDNLSFIDAVEMLSAEAGLQMPKPDPAAIEKAEKAKDLYSLLDEAASYFQSTLHAQEEVMAYVQGRGLSLETISAFRIGLAPADGQALRKHLQEKGYSDEQMIEAGLLKHSNRGKEPYIFFRERVMFPVADRRGRVVAFGGRILPDHLLEPSRSDFTPPKYINSSETPIFDKGRMLYGESIARQAARDGHSIIVTEGYMDVIACHQAGFKGAVAPMGTALTEDQILSLWSMIPSDEKVPVLCFDGDKAGRSAASRAVERFMPLLKPGQSSRLAFLPEGEDPDSLLRGKGREVFQKILQSSLSLFDFIWASHVEGRRFETPEARAGVIKTLKNEIHAIADKAVQTHYKSLLDEQISETFFARRQSKAKMPRKPNALKLRRPGASSNDMQVRILSAAILNHPYIYPDVEEAYGQLEMRSDFLSRLRQELTNILNQSPELDRDGLQTHLRGQGFTKEMGDILAESVYVHAAFASPGAESESVAAQWLDFWRALEGQGLKQEIKQGWKDAFHHSNEDEEEKLRNMVQMDASEG